MLKNRRRETSPMVMVDLPIPPGVTIDADDLTKLVQREGTVAPFQPTDWSALLYLRSLEPGQACELRYRLRAVMPGEVTVPSAVAYEYYDPVKVTRTGSVRLRVAAK
jgi:uncharacterized protein YfaS (alpha-2-macroglobulin family)